jgi:hypothetical protein
MSVQSLQNGSLQLRELTISNAYESQATSYEAFSSIITPTDITTPVINAPYIFVRTSPSQYVELINPSSSVLEILGSIKTIGLIDSTGSSGTAGQVPTANGLGGWAWTTPA